MVDPSISPLPMLYLGGARSWELPELTALNTLPPHALAIPYPADAALTGNPDSSPWRCNLNGEWQFKLLPNPDAATAEALAAEDWAPITVPGNWTMQGFGAPHYTNVIMPFPQMPPQVPAENPTGLYSRSFTVPDSWRGRRIVLHLAGCEGACYVYVNGAPIGLHKDARTPAEYDLTDVVRLGESNTLVAVVPRWSDASFIEDQDRWWQAGIHRDVFLYATDTVYLADLAVQAEPSEDGREGILRARCTLAAPGEAPERCQVEVQLYDPDGTAVFPQPLATIHESRIDSWGTRRFLRPVLTLEGRVAAPRLWSAESPVLYTVVVTVHGPSGPERASCRTGFRSVMVRDRQLLVNGRPVLIKGVNRHDHDDTTGSAVSRALMEADILLMKRYNINAVRASHYPNDSYWLDLCDRHGLYVFDEANIEAHAFYHEICRDPRYTRAFVERTRNMVERDKNHPSVIVWSLGNESGYGVNHDTAAGYVRSADPTRPLHYEGAISRTGGRNWTGGQTVTDIICPMYAPIADIVAWAQRETSDPRPLILCEYSHAMGNSNGCLADYWAAFEAHHGLQGGFIWEWVDHGIRRLDGQGRPYWGYGGDFGDQPNDGNFVCDGLVWPDRTPHPAMEEFKHLIQPVQVELADAGRGVIRIVNRQGFRGLEWLRGDWELSVDGVPRASGNLPELHAAPGEGQTITLDLGAADEPGERFLTMRFSQREATAWAPAGHEVAWDQLALPSPVGPLVLAKGDIASVKIESIQDCVVLRAGATRVEFDRRTGLLVGLTVGNRQPLRRGPLLNLWRAATDNDGLKLCEEAGKPLAHWLGLGLDKLRHQVQSFRVLEGPDTVMIEIDHAVSGRGHWEDASHSHRYTLLASGDLLVENVVKLGEDLADPPRVGVSLVIDPSYEWLAWVGRGPWDNYSDRKAGAMVGHWESTVTGQYVPYIMPQEHGHKCDTRRLRLSDEHGGLEVVGRPTFEFSALHFSDDDLFQTRHTVDLVPREEVFLNIDAAHRGLGTLSCGPDTLDRYKLREREYRFAFVLRVVGA